MNRLSDYSYDLPAELIAQTPASDRSGSRLMLLDPATGKVCHKKFYDLPAQLGPGDALVLNDTRVIPARIEARRATGGRVEIFLLEEKPDRSWDALARPTARLKEGERLFLEPEGFAVLNAYRGKGIWSVTFQGILPHEVGRMPLPHYIDREDGADPRDDLDRDRYQTVYARNAGAVAAPTAGLHFTEALLQALTGMGVYLVKLTLHVGVGTFAPVREEDFTLHEMHTERFCLSGESAEILNKVRREKGRIVAVGTTSARVLETVAADDGTLRAASGETGIFIHPPYRFKAVDALVTNFHLPRSTLLLLVSAFAGRERILDGYREAVENRYRFYSYGDAMYIGPCRP
jgi:S-adenosylmethionine:tRNA ribosyltransferase-isomerase